MSISIFNITPNTYKYVGGSFNTPNTVVPFPYQYAFGINDVGYGYTTPFTTSPYQNVAGGNSNVGFFPYADYNVIGLGWLINGPGLIDIPIIDIDSISQTITINEPYVFISGQSYTFSGNVETNEFFEGQTPVAGGYSVYCATPNVIHTANNNSELIQLSNVLLSSNYNTLYDAIYNLLDSNYTVVNYDLPDFPTNGLVTLVQSGFSSSFDVSFANNNPFWYSISQVGGGNFYFPNGAPSMSGNAIVFNGSYTNALITDPSNIPIGNSDYTISVWFNPSNLSGPQGLVGWGNYGTTNQCNALRLADGELINYWWDDDLVTFSSGISIGNWYNAVCTYQSSTNTRIMYLNGITIAYDNPTGTHAVPNANNTTIGYSGYGSSYFDGLIQNVAIYNNALGPIDVSNYYQAFLPLI